MDRLQKIRDSNFRALETNLLKIEHKYEEEVERLVQTERDKIRVLLFFFFLFF